MCDLHLHLNVIFIDQCNKQNRNVETFMQSQKANIEFVNSIGDKWLWKGKEESILFVYKSLNNKPRGKPYN